MKTIYSFLLVMLVATAASAQHFPADFIGHWKGEMEEIEQGGKMEKLPIQVVVQLSDTPGQYIWYMYSVKRDSLAFILKPIDSAKGQWVFGLRGMLFHQYWLGGRLRGMYTVGPGADRKTVNTMYWLEEGKLVMEFSSNDSRPFSSTGQGTSDSPVVQTYQLQSVIKAVLKKENASR